MAKKDAKTVKKAAKAKAKKHWVPIIAPKSFNNVQLGDTGVADTQQTVGKTVTANLMNLMGDMRKQGVEIRFDVVKVSDGAAVTAVTGYELLPSSMKRLVRRGRSKVADSFVVRTATGRLVRLKPVVITANRVSSAAATAIRHAIKEQAKHLVTQTSFDRLVQDLIAFKIQRTLKDAISKIHPIKSVEVRSCTLLAEGMSDRRSVSEDTREEDFAVETKEEPKQQTPAE